MGRAAGQRAVVVRALAEAVAALRAAEGRAVLLLSAPGAGATLGAPGWRALVRAALAAVPGAAARDALCCGAAPGHALAALREGCRIVVLDGALPAFPAIAAAAAETGAEAWRARPPALDLRELDLRRPAARAVLAAWLGGAPHDSAPVKG
jgi:hypothetical protein